MKSISVTDLQLIPELSHLRMLDFIDPKYDSLISPFLKILGFDLDYPIEFAASQHRNLQGQKVIAYRIIGEVECNDAFLSSAFATTEDRIIARGYNDLGLSNDMASQLTVGRDYGGDDTGQSEKGFPPELTNEDEDEITLQVQLLTDLLRIVRGNPFKQDGSRATLAEYGMEETPEKTRKKSVRKNKASLPKAG